MCSPSAPAPAASQTTTTELPEWARPYAQKTLARGEALTDINQNPYQTYGQPRIAGFSPLQEQAQAAAGRLGPTQQTAQASDFAAQAGLGALNMPQYQAGRFSGGTFSPYAAGMYMSPFIEQAMQPQLREAQRSSDILGTQQRGQATQAGAFGGNRQVIMEAERQRNLGTQLGDIRARGYQTAYEQAANQFNQDMQRRMQAQQLGEQSRQFGANIGLQGLQTGLQAAGTLGTLGQQQFGQQQQAIDAQSRMGAQQQALQQQGLTQAYQDFLNQQNYPYKQLGFFSDLVRGLPLGQQSTTQMYQPGPSALQTMSGIGLGAYGMKQLGMFADGGAVGYKNGGMTVMDKFNDPEAMLADMDKMTEAQLQAIIKAPTTPAEAEAAKRELAMRASERQGLASAYNQVPYDARAQMVRAAGGGIIAFAKPEASNNYSLVSSEDDDASEAGQQLLPTRYADPDAQRQLMQKGMSIADYLLQPSGYKAPTSAERLAYMKDYAKEISDAAGPSASGDIRAYIKEQREALGKEREEAKGFAALQAMGAITQPGGFVRGLGAAGSAFGSAMEKANAAQRAAKNQFAMMEFNLADADRKERMGLHRDARAAFDESEKNKLAGLKLDREAKAAAGNVVSKLAQANRVTGAGAGAGGAKMPQVDRQAAAISDQIAALESSNPNDPKLPLLRKQLEGRLKIISTGKDVGPQRAELMAGQIFSRASESVQKTVRSQALMDDEWRNAMANGDSAGMAAALDRLTEAQMKRQGVTNPQGGPSAGSRRPPPPPGFNPVQ